MARKNDAFYFENFITCTDFAVQSPKILERNSR